MAWHKVEWSRGSWAAADARRRLQMENGRVFLAGDHMNMNAWMQGAFESGREVATAIHARAMRQG